LEGTRQGVDWKLGRWEELAEALERRGHWDEAELTHAFDLLGVPHLERAAAHLPQELEATRQVIRGEVERLERWRDEVLIPGEEHERLAAMLGVPVNETKSLRLLRRYEREHAHKYMRLAEKLGLKVREGPALAAPRPVPECEEFAEEIEEAPALAPEAAPATAPEVGEAPEPAKAAASGLSAPPEVDFRVEPGDPLRGSEGSQGPPGLAGVSGRSPCVPPNIH
jgi:hypothetical protein